MTTRFTDELMEQGLAYKVLTLVSQIDVNNEFEKLQRERGLGSEKHRKEVSVQCVGSQLSVSNLEGRKVMSARTFF